MAARITYPPGVGQWMPQYTRDIERAIDDAVAQSGSGSVSTFTVDGGNATTNFSAGGYLLVDFGGAS